MAAAILSPSSERPAGSLLLAPQFLPSFPSVMTIPSSTTDSNPEYAQQLGVTVPKTQAMKIFSVQKVQAQLYHGSQSTQAVVLPLVVTTTASTLLVSQLVTM